MRNSKLIGYGLLHALAVFVYVILIALFFSNGERFFSSEKVDNFTAPLFMLMLLVLSAATVGTLIFARPVYVYLEGKKKDAIKLLAYTLLSLVLIVLIILSVITLSK